MARELRGISAHHTVDICQDEGSMTEAVADFMATGYYASEPLVLITTSERHEAICTRLSSFGISWIELEQRGEAIFCNGIDLLGRFMLDGMPDESAFRTAVGEVLTDHHRGRSRRIRCFGDMVDVLCARGEGTAALRLEELWNDLARSHAFTLLCGYIKRNLYREVNGRLSDRICGQHAHVRQEPPPERPSPHRRGLSSPG